MSRSFRSALHTRNANSAPMGWRDQLSADLPELTARIRSYFRRLAIPRAEHADVLQECFLYLSKQYARFEQRGRLRHYTLSTIAYYAILKTSSKRAQTNRKAASHKALCPFRFSETVGAAAGRDGESAQNNLTDKRTATPYEIVQPRLDFAEYFATLPAQSRTIVDMSLAGESGQTIARKLGLSAGRVSQLRREIVENYLADPEE